MVGSYIKNSSVRVSVELNPFQWKLWSFTYAGPSPMDPGRHLVAVRLLPFLFVLSLDDGRIGYEAYEQMKVIEE
jgi:hypothetical protein